MNGEKREALRNALVAIVEAAAEPEYSVAGLTDHYAAIFGVPVSDLEHEVALYGIERIVLEMRVHRTPAAHEVEHLRDTFLREDMDEGVAA